ncbi:MAG: acetyl-CoA C-acyltransferase [Gammaproteobacteria bacterium]|jgi:acetyl-CoA C-acetyltransferase|nr:acetyl-CoA C-acyltransferase [Gammaproteobacteria bacterium]
MKSSENNVYLLGGARIPFARSFSDYATFSRKELMLASLSVLVKKLGLKNKLVDDVAIGAVINSASDWNLARECILATDLNPETPAYNIQRACGTSLEAAWHIALKVHTGAIDYGIAGGVDTNSDMPFEASTQLQKALLKFKRAKTFLHRLNAIKDISLSRLKLQIPTIREPQTHLSMGEHCELMVKEWHISRKSQDELSLASHINAARAYDQGFFDRLVYPFNSLIKDATIRSDTSLEKLAKLKPAFDAVNGTLTAGNSSPLSDGSACVLIGNIAAAHKLGLNPVAKIIDFQVAAVNFVYDAGLLMAPTKAVAKLLLRNRLTFEDIDYFEIHEAFAGQVLCTLKAWESEKYCREQLGLTAALGSIDRKKLNIVGSSIAIGHPFAATGARILATLGKLLADKKPKRGLISICTAGGMGIAALLESA